MAIGTENDARMKGVGKVSRGRHRQRLRITDASLIRGFSLGFVVVQPTLDLGFQLLALVMGRLIQLGSVSAVKRDLVDRPKQDNREKEQRKGAHGVTSVGFADRGTVTSEPPVKFRRLTAATQL